MSPLLLTGPEVEAWLKCQRTKRYELDRLGLIESVKVQGSRRYIADSVAAYVESLRAEVA